MKLKKGSPIFGIIIAVAVIVIVVAGAFFMLQIMKTSLDADIQEYDEQLNHLVALVEPETYSSRETAALYEEVQAVLSKLSGESVTLYILNEDQKSIEGSYINYVTIPRKYTYIEGEEYYDNERFFAVWEKIYRGQAEVIGEKTFPIDVSNLMDWNFVEQMSQYRFVVHDKVYYEKEFVTTDGKELTLLFSQPLTVSGRTMQNTIHLIFVYILVVLALWVISICQAIARADNYRKILRLAYFDTLTKIMNRIRFEAEAYKKFNARKPKKYALVSVDVSKFKVVNDFYGKEYANEILKNMATILSKERNRGELVARDQADTFMLLLRYESTTELDERLHALNQKLENRFAEQNIRFKLGVYIIEDLTLDVSRMINYANMAADRVITSSDGSVFYFDEKQRECMRQEKMLENEMESALQNNEFAVYLQPKYYADGSGIGGAEALVRWISPKMGFIPPGMFIPLFEKNGFIIRLDLYMLEKVCMQQKQWMDAGKELITISVNISRIHLLEATLVEDIRAIVDKYGLPHSCIELELTESAFFDDKTILISTIERLQNVGFTVSMDDFGSGYSSLNSLKDLPLDAIKLDGEFFRDAQDEKRSQTIVKDTIEMARDLEMKIVAEGIEKEEQVNFLNKNGCDLIQGFYFAKPMPIADFEKLAYLP